MPQTLRFLKACHREPVDATPIWIMRQAGRYLPEYRKIREQHSFLDMVHAPELAAEVTLQPLRRFDLDAAIIFSDILPCLDVMGLRVEFIKGQGPKIINPLRDPLQVEELATPEPEETLHYTLDALKIVRRELDNKKALIGFAGAPFTLACYAIEGSNARDFVAAKLFMHEHPKAWRRFMEKLATVVGNYLRAQIAAGAQAVQLFDSWAGSLSPFDYQEYVLPYVKRTIQIATNGDEERVPIIYFGTDTAGLFPIIRDLDVNVIGVDWRIEIDQAWSIIGHDRAVQGNLDPHLLMTNIPTIERHAARVLEAVNGRPGHIFNLGHGINKETPIDHVNALVEFVHSYSRKLKSTTATPN